MNVFAQGSDPMNVEWCHQSNKQMGIATSSSRMLAKNGKGKAPGPLFDYRSAWSGIRSSWTSKLGE